MGDPLRRVRHDLVYYPFRLLLAGGSRVPLAFTRPLGILAGRLALALARTDRRRAREHLAIAFPEKPDADREVLLRHTARHLGLMLAEVLWLWRTDPQEVRGQVSMVGAEHLEAARARGRGAVLVTGHCGNWELMNARLGAGGIPMSIAVREVYDPRLHEVATALRARFGAQVISRGPTAGRRLVASLLANRVVGLLIDQDIRDIPGVFVPFFGHPAWTPSGAAQLALRARVPVVPAFISRAADGTHKVEVRPPIEPTGDAGDPNAVTRLTAEATNAIEQQIRAHPEQWVWMHRRWRTRPEPAVRNDD
ncbi:MAG: lysophospholipid acyltransferase family protein [Acidobacteria bacterium]|nr:lysophospholipid acyltransferase family protein [Acidobacteriota bacterium]